MGILLEKFLLTMKDEHRNTLLELMEQNPENISYVDRVMLEKQLKKLIETVDSESNFSFNPIAQSGKMKSKAYNRNMNEIETDLRIIFYVSSLIDQYMSSHFRLITSEMQEMKKMISDIKKKLKRFKLLSQKTVPFSDYSFENFEFPEKTETDLEKLNTLGKGRSGEEYKKEDAAEIRGNKLVLSSVEATDQLKTGYGRALADIHISRRNGYVEEMKGHDIRKAFDTSEETYWAENLIVDSPIDHDDNSHWARAYASGDLQGAIVEIEISLHNVATVSEIHYNPFGFYPLQVLSITGYERSDFGGEVYDLISPSHENPNQRSQTSIENMVFRFPSVDIGSLRIMIRQETYTRSNYIINANESNSHEFWMSMSEQEQTMPDYIGEDESFGQFEKKLEASGWMNYLSDLEKWALENEEKLISRSARKAMELVHMGDYQSGLMLGLKATDPRIEIPENLDNEFKAVAKTSYIYGAKNIKMYGRKYKESSTYVSKRLDLSVNIKKLSIVTEEEHEYFIDKNTGEKVKVTDIEFYITGKKNPSVEEWNPILPLGQQMVDGERLLVDNIGGRYLEFQKGSIEYSLRFRAISKGSVTVYRNNEPIPEHHYTVSDDLRKIAIKKEHYIPTSIYTVKYQPSEDAYFYDISSDEKYQPSQYIDDNGQNGEVFKNVEVGTEVKLKHIPLISRESLLHEDEDPDLGYFQKEDFINSSAIDYPVHVWADGERLMNVTQYDSGTYDPEDLKKNNGYTFAQVGRKIIFGVPEESKTHYDVVNIDYRYIVTDVRVKAILRRNTLNTDSVTPALIEYSVRAETDDLITKEGGVYID